MNETRYVMINKTGNQMYSSDSMIGFWASTLFITFLSIIVMAAVAFVLCTMASLFS